MKIVDQEFLNDDVALDGNSFTRCTFRQCRLIYSGKAPVHMILCNYFDIKWVFEDSAQLTLGLLSEIVENSGDYGRSLLVHTFPTLRAWLTPPALAILAKEDAKSE